VQIKLAASGGQTLYEIDATLVVYGESERALAATTKVLSVRDDPIVYDFEVPAERIADYRVIFEWLEPGPKERPGGAKVGITSAPPLQFWAPYPGPFRYHGRWKKDTGKPINGSPYGIDRTPEPPK